MLLGCHLLAVYELAARDGVSIVYARPVELAGAAIHYIVPPVDDVVGTKPTYKIIPASAAVQVVASARTDEVISTVAATQRTTVRIRTSRSIFVLLSRRYDRILKHKVGG